MRTYKLFTLLTGFLFLLNSCSDDFLYTVNPNRQTSETFWKSEKDVSAALASAYGPLRTPIFGYFGGQFGFGDINGLGDDIFTIPGEEPATWQIISFTNDPNNTDINEMWNLLYRSVYRSNLVIANTPNVSGLTDAQKTAYIAEAKFLRGFANYLLVLNFGAVPLRMEPALTTDLQYIEKSPAEDVWAAVVQDLTDAAAGLPATRSGAELGRATSGAALAYLGKAYLIQNKYDLAESTLLKLQQSPYNYGLVPNYEDNFTSLNEFNQEDVFSWVCAPVGTPGSAYTYDGANHPFYNFLAQFIGPPLGGGWFKYVPSNFLINEFVKEERPAGSDTRFDKRMYVTLFWKHSEFGEEDTNMGYGGSTFDEIWESGISKIARFYPTYNFDTLTVGRFLIRKFTNAWQDVANTDNVIYGGAKPESSANYVIMRYAEVLLNLAEAQIKNGHLPEAIANINIIRGRAGLPAKTSADLPNADAVMAEMQHQKLLELFCEQNRWNDLRRWYPDATQLRTVYLANDKQGAAAFQAKHYLFPIPQTELNANPNITQNPLW
ncbi:MAG: RagB/SusD family nutrient uptake outer membrane protein [Tannerella sp.]|jgi:hypothetical protein|nr:RagB/SusD family nutrient uptake outer membrane protein [Tannerella sp.]